MSQYIHICYHHGGILSRDQNGRIAYVNGKVESLGEVDIDYVNLNDIMTICTDFGYEKCRRILWLKPDVPNFELALKPLTNDADIIAMCEAAVKNGNEMHVYFEDCISSPEFVDEPELLEGADHGGEEEEEEGEKEEGKKDQGEEDQECRSKRKMTHNDEDEEGEEEEDEEDEEEEDEGHMSFEEEGYDYNSEELRTPPSSDDEPDVRAKNLKFNDQSVFGHVQLELGMEFVSLDQFKNAVID